jgi:Na+/pantothenate symporter
MYTDTIQAFIMIFGGVLVAILFYKEIGGLSNLYCQYLHATATTVNNNSKENFTCGQPTTKEFQNFKIK